MKQGASVPDRASRPTAQAGSRLGDSATIPCAAAGDKVSIGGAEYTVTWSSDEMTDEDRYQSHMMTANFMEQYGLSGAFQRHLAEQYRRDSD